MLQWDIVETARIADGGEFVLARQGHQWVVRVDQRILMSNLMYNSEIALAQRALHAVPNPRKVLIGGLGLGYTLRAALDCLPARSEVTVVELVPELIGWNRKYLRKLNGHPLGDSRSRVVVGDVFDTIKSSNDRFDAILLDVDNGPRALAQPKNQRLYGKAGLRACHDALRPNGVVAIWSAEPNAHFERKLQSAHFDVDVQHVPARIGALGQHVLFLARARPLPPPSAPARRRRR